MIRSVKVSLRTATRAKHRRLDALRREVLACIRRYVDFLWRKRGKLDAETLGRVSGGSLSYRHRSNCLKVALETITATRRSAKALDVTAGRPHIGGAIRLSSLVAKVECGKGSFDHVLKVSGLVKGRPIVIPFRSHRTVKRWLSAPGARLLDGCTLGDGWAALWIEIPDTEFKADSKVLGIDLGLNKLVATSDGGFHGKRMREICDRVRRRRPGSEGRRRAVCARRDYVSLTVKNLPWSDISTIGVEDLKGIKQGKRKGRGKKFRKKIAPWAVREATARIEQLAQEHRVRLVFVDPRGTSRTCPSCGSVAKANRRGEHFQCVSCNYSADADFVGALNVLAKTLGQLGAGYGRSVCQS